MIPLHDARGRDSGPRPSGTHYSECTGKKALRTSEAGQRHGIAGLPWIVTPSGLRCTGVPGKAAPLFVPSGAACPISPGQTPGPGNDRWAAPSCSRRNGRPCAHGVPRHRWAVTRARPGRNPGGVAHLGGSPIRNRITSYWQGRQTGNAYVYNLTQLFCATFVNLTRDFRPLQSRVPHEALFGVA